MKLLSMIVRGRRVAEISEEYESRLKNLPRDIRDDLIEAQQAQIEALSGMLIELGRERRERLAPVLTEENMPAVADDLARRVWKYAESAVLARWERFVSRVRPRWL